jgi:hypothetical protein
MPTALTPGIRPYARCHNTASAGKDAGEKQTFPLNPDQGKAIYQINPQYNQKGIRREYCGVRGANVEEVGATDIEETKLPTPVSRIYGASVVPCPQLRPTIVACSLLGLMYFLGVRALLRGLVPCLHTKPKTTHDSDLTL